MKTLILLLSSLLVLSGCESTHLSSNSENGGGQTSDGLGLVAGVWRFSHVGPPSIQSSELQGVDVSSIMEQQLKGSKFSIRENGDASFTGGGTSGSFRVKVVEETPIYIKMGASHEGVEAFYVYDKADKLIVMQSPMTLNEDSKGTIPLYYKRA